MNGDSHASWRHATALVIGEAGLLVLGASGSGKSSLADALIADAMARGHFAALVGDDRVAIRRQGDRVILSGHPRIISRIERRGEGIGSVPSVARAVLRLIVVLEEAPERLPEGQDMIIEGLHLPLLTLCADSNLTARTHRVLALLGH